MDQEKKPTERLGDFCSAMGLTLHPAQRSIAKAILSGSYAPPLSPTEGLITRHRPLNSAGYRTMAELMRKSRVERDFGGVEDA